MLARNASVLLANVRRHSRTFATATIHTSTTILSDKTIDNLGAIKKETVEYDVIINGGGVVGFSLLAALSKSPYFEDKKILLLEQQPKRNATLESKVDVGERKLSNRVSSLTTASKNFFENLGVWSGIEPLSKKATIMYVWSEHFKDGISFTPRYPGISDALCDGKKTSDDSICYFIENHVLLNSLEKSIPENRIRYGANVTDVQANANKVDVLIDGEERITANLLVGCDGFNSLVRRKSTLEYKEFALQEKGIVGTVEILRESEFDQNDVAFQRFLSDGTVVALLPLTDHYSSFVISAPNKRSEHLMSLGDEEFIVAMNDLLVSEMSPSHLNNPLRSGQRTIERLLNKIAQPSEPPRLSAPQLLSVVPKSRASFPLGFATTVPSLVGSPKGSSNNKVAIIGDSSHRIQPLAGQGLNLGIGDAIELSEQLETSLRRGDDIFSGHAEGDEGLTKALFAFERQRQFKLVPMMAAVASMQTVFSYTPSAVLKQLNALGLFKNEIVKFANSR